ncbi:arylsulfatase B-like [Lineus longissimus]|uniref:arylsulfatase B-like n=1 Tax=Lineus longissimus TaxID=88925 RepID=UPI00315DEFFE
MMTRMFLPTFLILSFVSLTRADNTQTNIVFIVADDLGWNDVSWTNPDIISPNLERMARAGIILNQSYVMPVCSPSRSCFMSGRFPYHTGMQYGVINSKQPYGLPLNLTTLPSLLKDAGYATHIVGKWHQGFCSWAYTPTYRGFDSFYGYYNAAEDYYQHSIPLEPLPHTTVGTDFRDDKLPVKNENGSYSTYLYTERVERIIRQHNTSQPLFLYLPYQSVHEPLEVPKKYEEMYANIKDDNRRIFSGMVTSMDDSVGYVMAALEDRGMMDSTLVIFTSDNGGQYRRGGNNFPLRGNKGTLWEGGTRIPAFVYGNLLKKSRFTYTGMMHAVDWYPTIVEVAKAKLPDYDIDGTSLWQALNANQSSPRNSFVYNLNVKGRDKAQAGIRVGDWKLLVGDPGPAANDNGWYPPPAVTEHKPFDPEGEAYEENEIRIMTDMMDEHMKVSSVRRESRPKKIPKYQLYNIRDDPTEHHDLSQQFTVVLAQMIAFYEKLAETETEAMDPPEVEGSDPKYWGGMWSPGWC